MIEIIEVTSRQQARAFAHWRTKIKTESNDARTCKKQYMHRLVVHTYKQGIVEFVMRQIFDQAHNLNIQVLNRQ